MSQQVTPRWEAKRTDQSRLVEERLRREFSDTDAYRFNSVSIRVRVIDPRFEGKTEEEREAMVEPLINELPSDIQADIMGVLLLAPSETPPALNRKSLVNLEFEDPSESGL